MPTWTSPSTRSGTSVAVVTTVWSGLGLTLSPSNAFSRTSYAQRAKLIKNNARVNVDATSATIALLRRQVVQLRQQVLQLQGGAACGLPDGFTTTPPASTSGGSKGSGAGRGAGAQSTTDTALYQALQRVAALEARNSALEEALQEASLAAASSSDDYAELTGQLLDVEVERDMLRYVPQHAGARGGGVN